MDSCKLNTYDCFELTFPVNPVTLTVTLPGGDTETVSFFERRPVHFEYDRHGYEAAVPTGEVVYTARYFPHLAGTYSYSAGKACGSFEVVNGSSHGYICPDKTDSRYFSFGDGTPFPIIGVNLAMLTGYPVSSGSEFGLSGNEATLGLKEYERWFKKLSAVGGNHARIWCGQPYLCPDTESPYELRLEQFEKLDAIFELAKKYGIYLKITIDQFRFFGKSRNDAVYDENCKKLFGKSFSIDGKACPSMTAWLRSDEYRRAWISKLKAYTDRYAGNPYLMVLEFWNEMNAVEADWNDTIDWNRYMARAARPLLPYNMLSQSLGSMDSENGYMLYRTFPFELFDFSQFHRYLDQGAQLDICHSDGFEFTADGIKHAQRPGMPVILAETGAVNDCHSGPFRYYMSDDRGRIFADTVLPAFFYGAAGVGQIWHWGIYVEQKNLWKLLQPFTDAISGINMCSEGFVSHDLSTEDCHTVILEGKSTVLGIVRSRLDSWERILRDGNEPQPLNTSFNSSAGKLSIFPIWEDEPAEAELTEGTLSIHKLTYGLIFRIDK